MIYIRDDDVLVRSSGYSDPVAQFKGVHQIIARQSKVLHVPTILVTEIQEFPDCIDYIWEETCAGRMRPEIHGFKHIDYGKLPPAEIREHLLRCMDFILHQFHYLPTKFYTPWGASTQDIRDVCKGLNLEMVDGSSRNKLRGKSGAWQMIQDGYDLNEVWKGQDIHIHWWEDTERLEKVLELL